MIKLEELVKNSNCKKNKQQLVDLKDINERFILEFKFTPIQKEAIKLVYEMRILSTSQLTQILNKNIKYVRDQLLILYKNKFLYRMTNSVIGEGTKESYWMLDVAGALFIAGAYGIKVKQLNWDIRDNLIKFEKLSHALKISEIRTILEVNAREKGHKIESCFCDRHLYYEFNQEDKNCVLRPDMFLIYNDGSKIYQYFFEIDMGTMTITGPRNRTSVVISKIPKYENFKSSGGWKEYFDVYPRIVFLTTTKSRALYMADSIKKTQTTNQEVLISTFNFFEQDPLGDIFKVVNDGSETNMFK